MKFLLAILIILLSFFCVLAQQDDSNIQIENSINSFQNPSNKTKKERKLDDLKKAFYYPELEETGDFSEEKDSARESDFWEDPKSENDKELEKKDDHKIKSEEKFHWKPALAQSGIFLGIQHAFRMTQPKTRRELDGPFFRDWGRSVRSLRGWRDGNKFFTNYIAHPLQGGVTGWIFINNSDRAKKQEFGKSKKYWETRLKAMAWSAVWSTQFELGPISEATLGNVGTFDPTGRNKMAWVDLIVTPVVGTGMVIGEDALDKYVLKNWLEKNTGSRTMIKTFRIIFTPTRSFANILSGKAPWHRNDRTVQLGGIPVSN